MRAAMIRSWGAPLDVVEVGDTDEPLVGPDGVLVGVAAAGVNPVDWRVAAGGLQNAYPWAFPITLGWDVAGTVLAAGPAVTRVAVGDRVAAYARKDHIQFGTFAERVAVPERAISRVPDEVTLDRAGALPLAGLTAQQLLDAAAVGMGEIVLIHAAAGGVGTFASQLAVMRGATVIGTASPPNHPALSARGVVPVDYSTDLVDRVRDLAPDGVDVVLDLVGGVSLERTPRLLRPGGRLAGIVDPGRMAQLSGEYGYHDAYIFVRPDSQMLGRLLDLVADDRLVIDVADRYPLEESAQALEANRSGHTRGKIVIDVPGD